MRGFGATTAIYGRGNKHRPPVVDPRVKRTLSNLLDASVVGGYSRIGWEVRSRTGGFAPPESMDLRGRRIVVTGPTSGLGRETARMLAVAGADLVLVGRDGSRTENVARELDQSGPGTMQPVVADMSDLESVAAAARAIGAGGNRVDALVHNAGALDKVRTESPQGHETTLAAHVLGPFLMTRMLIDNLSAAHGRVVTVSSGGMYTAPLPRDPRTADVGEPPFTWNGTRQYAIAKRMQVTLNEMWALEQPDVWFAAMHPGWADTPGVRTSLPAFRLVTAPLLRTARQGADTIAWLAGTSESGLATGRFWCDREERPIHRIGRTRASDTAESRNALWQWCTESTTPFLSTV